MKFLPGAFDSSSEINVAVAVNKADSVPSSSLLRDIAELAADAEIPLSYDLFDPAYPCRVDQDLGVRTTGPERGDPTPLPRQDPNRRPSE